MADGGASESDLEEIAEGRASADDKREAAETFHVHSRAEARARLKGKIKTTHRRTKKVRYR